jgi:hypothetical protein
MEGSVSAPPQRVCPKCARISWATGPRCPYCRAPFRRQNASFAWMLAAAVLVTLAGVLLMLLLFGRHVDKEVDQRADKIEREFNDIRRQIDRRLPPVGAVPSVTPFPTPTPTATPSPTDTPTPTSTPSPTETATPTATDTPSSDSGDSGDDGDTVINP